MAVRKQEQVIRRRVWGLTTVFPKFREEFGEWWLSSPAKKNLIQIRPLEVCIPLLLFVWMWVVGVRKGAGGWQEAGKRWETNDCPCPSASMSGLGISSIQNQDFCYDSTREKLGNNPNQVSLTRWMFKDIAYAWERIILKWKNILQPCSLPRDILKSPQNVLKYR